MNLKFKIWIIGATIEQWIPKHTFHLHNYMFDQKNISKSIQKYTFYSDIKHLKK